MKDHLSADLMLPRTPAPRRKGAPPEGAPGRFSPLNAPQRAAVDAFCSQSRPWARKQAGRSYRHLPEELREQAIDQAMQALSAGAPAAVDRRTLHAALAEELTEALRRAHVGWCLNQSSALWQDDVATAPPAAPTPPAGDPLADFIEDGLGGLERAVLQLEIGAGRDSRTVRAALRLRPREYARHREEGLSKLRDAITGRVLGRVCDHHVAAVVLAATGDKLAANRLAGGVARCRSCSREAQGLRRILNERLALAPFPFVIKPAGVLAAKLGALGAAFGKGAGSGAGAVAGGGSIGTGASAMTAVLAAAAIATGGAAAIDGPSKPVSKPAVSQAAGSTAASAKTTRAAAAPAERAKAAADRKRAGRHAARKRTGAPKTSTPAVASPAPTGAPVTASAPATTQPGPPSVERTVHDTVGAVRDTVGKVTKPLAPSLAEPVDKTLAGVQQTVDQLTGTVDQLLAGGKK